MKSARGRTSRAVSNVASSLVLGKEPVKAGSDLTNDRVALALAYSWYNSTYTAKEGRPWVIAWMEKNGYTKTQIEHYRVSEIWRTSITMCSIARMLTLGVKLSGAEPQFLRDNIAEVLRRTPMEVEQKASSGPSKALLAVTALDAALDAHYDSKYTTRTHPTIKDELNKLTLTPTDATIAARHIRRLVNELNSKGGSDHLTKKQKTAYQNYLAWLIFCIEGQVAPKKAKTRKKKIKSPEVLVSKVKYMISDAKLGLKSIAPTLVLGKMTAWIYNTRYNKLSLLVSKTGLTIQGTTVKGFDEKLSATKRVKPKMVKTMVSQTDVRRKKVMAEFKAVPSKTTGRMNADTLILWAN